MKKALLLVAIALVSASSAFAHGNETHVMGKVTRITADSITIQTVKNTTVTVVIDASTKFIKSGTAATMKDLKTGDRVVVGAEKDGGRLHAHSVKFGKSATNSSKMDHSTMNIGDMKH